MEQSLRSTSIKSKQLEKILECPVCLDLPIPPIYTCVNGHIICSICKPKMEFCGLCKGVFINTRNLVAENLFEITRMPCRYSDHGCNTILSGKDYKLHIQSCPLRPILCYDTRTTSCRGTAIDSACFFQHLKKDHKAKGCDEERECFEKKSGCMTFDIDTDAPYFYLKYNGNVFLQHSSLKNQMLYWWITLIGSEEEASLYKSIITIYNNPVDSKVALSFEYTVPVHSIRASADDIIKSKHVASLSTESLLPFCKQGVKMGTTNTNYMKYTWNMKFSIRQL